MTKLQVEKKLEHLMKSRGKLNHRVRVLEVNGQEKMENIMQAAKRRADASWNKTEKSIHRLDNQVHHLSNQIEFLKEKLGYMGQ